MVPDPARPGRPPGARPRHFRGSGGVPNGRVGPRDRRQSIGRSHFEWRKLFQTGLNSPCSPRYGQNTDFGPVWADLGAHWAGPGSARPAPAPAPKNSFCQFAGTGGTFGEKVHRPFLCSFPSRIVWSKKNPENSPPSPSYAQISQK